MFLSSRMLCRAYRSPVFQPVDEGILLVPNPENDLKSFMLKYSRIHYSEMTSPNFDDWKQVTNPKQRAVIMADVWTRCTPK